MNFICSGVLILGGLNQSSDMIDFQTHIDSLRGGIRADIHNQSYCYKQLLKNILYSDSLRVIRKDIIINKLVSNSSLIIFFFILN
jgi:hypothetical protein